MDIRTRCLDIVCLLLLIYPVAVPSILSNMLYNRIRHDSNKQTRSFWIFSIINFALVALLIMIQPNFEGALSVSAHYFRLSPIVFLGFVLGPLLILTEFAVGALCTKLQKKKISSFTVSEQIGREKTWNKAAVMIVAVMEELLFRDLGYFMTVEKMGWSVALFLLFTSFLYAINHLHEGLTVSLQKLASGFVFGLSFVLTGSLMLVPIIAHVTENIIIMIWSRKAYE